ncbi:hypothetical protein EMPS_02521 [Entomortierella parvispora]|uniref:Uncharacterized protein n=1 Tax=Entomortierella parvispora TaxID=205924 RepID=A0A9P3H5K6_9FUNG|nr:hypothetical protein EMPS_02521 [Entomortierella parvispora]
MSVSVSAAASMSLGLPSASPVVSPSSVAASGSPGSVVPTTAPAVPTTASGTVPVVTTVSTAPAAPTQTSAANSNLHKKLSALGLVLVVLPAVLLNSF